jgi:hypothetical protein
MYSHLGVNLIVVVTAAATVAFAVLLHYEGLRLLSTRLVSLGGVRRRKVLLGVYGVILLHVAEIWMFGLCIWGLTHLAYAGNILGAPDNDLLDSVYLSATTFATVGFGDLVPVGPVRLVTGTEALSGFILITWSASFLYLEMQEFWRNRR